jgi:hypothetical protein
VASGIVRGAVPYRRLPDSSWPGWNESDHG